MLAWDGSNKLSPGSYGINTQDTNANSFGKSVTTIVVVEVEPPDRPQLSGSSGKTAIKLFFLEKMLLLQCCVSEAPFFSLFQQETLNLF